MSVIAHSKHVEIPAAADQAACAAVASSVPAIVGFLRKALDQSFFPELWDVRTELREAPPVN